MDQTSPHMYDNNNTDPRKGLLGGGPQGPSALKVKSLTPLTPANPNSTNMTPAEGELAELTTSEISLDLQGLIDDSHFGDDNLFGDLIEAKKNELNNGYGLPSRNSPTGSLGGSSGQSSPGGVTHPNGTPGEGETPPYQQYRNPLTYMPGSVHNGAAYGATNPSSGNNVQVKQEPQDQVSSAGTNYHHGQHHQRNTHNNVNNNNNGFSAVSSTTPNHGGPVANANANNGGFPPSMSTVLPALKSFAQVPKYLQPHSSSSSTPAAIKKKMDRNSDEYRRRRERNNVAVRKSREKAKARTRETEERVKILARENERLQKKVELLQEELSVLRSLFSNVGVLPEHIHRELSKHMDNFQQQHNAMACI